MISLTSNNLVFELARVLVSYHSFAEKNLKEVSSNLSLNQAVILLKLIENPDISIHHLGTYLFKDAQATRRILNLLVLEKYLIYEKQVFSDTSKYVPTPRALQIIKEIRPVLEHNHFLALRGLTPKQLEVLNATMSTILKNIHNNQPLTNY
ncbi:MAG: hypothetical protein OIF50_07535 [Flavobacteriaceae bacterium]|nr:hypothetical protein [Flavobacteriaceae bacterium]